MRSQSESAEEPVLHRIAEGESEVDSPVGVVGYAWGGREVDPDSPESVAKKSTDAATGRETYWVKRATVGPERGFMFNPQAPTFNPAAANKTAKHLGRHKYEYRKVNRAAFELYLKFINPPHNPLNLRGAERASA